MLDFIIGLCAYNNIRGECFKSIQALHEETGWKFKCYVQLWDALIGRSRSIVATRFLDKKESDILLYVDSDIQFTPEDIRKIIDGQRKGYDILTGGYLKSDGYLALRTLNDIRVKDMKVGQIYPIEYGSTGFFSISRKALEKMVSDLGLPLLHEDEPEARCYPFFESGRDFSGRHKFYISEDWDFCEKCKNAGFQTYWHTGVLVCHVKEMLLIPNASFSIKEDIPTQAVVNKDYVG